MAKGRAKPKASRTSRTGETSKAAKSPPREAKPVSRTDRQKGRGSADWREATLSQVRALILEAEPEMSEERKWKKPSNAMAGVPVWSHHGIVCTGETYKQAVKLTFAKGASLKDPQGLFNSSLEGNTRRAMDIKEGESLDPKAFKALIKAAVAENLRSNAPKSKSSPKAAAKGKSGAAEAKQTKHLSGGNPQIAKADGDAPVQAYIDAMPGWKSELGKRLDALIVLNVPNVNKAVKWNSPFYGIEGQGWFLSFHVFTHYVKVTFFNGASLRPVPPGGTPKSKETRWIDLREVDQLDDAQMASWVKQAALLPGWRP